MGFSQSNPVHSALHGALCSAYNIRIRAEKSVYHLANRERILTYQREYGRDHKDDTKRRNTHYYKNNRENILLQKRIYVESNKEKLKARDKAWRDKNKASRAAKEQARRDLRTPEQKKELLLRARIRNMNRLKSNPEYRLQVLLRTRLYQVIRNSYKTGSAVQDLGCSVEYLKAYLEGQFEPGMAWDNWGRRGWHIDHIRPLASFDLTDPEQFRQAVHYTNLQPLWAKVNLSKGSKI